MWGRRDRKLWADLPKLGKLSHDELLCFAEVELILGLQIARAQKYGSISQIYEVMATVMDRYLEYQEDESGEIESQTEREVRNFIWETIFKDVNVQWIHARAAVEVIFRLLVRMISRTTYAVLEMRAGKPAPAKRQIARELCD